eukprot:643024-Prymnesium_polylepis.1
MCGVPWRGRRATSRAVRTSGYDNRLSAHLNSQNMHFKGPHHAPVAPNEEPRAAFMAPSASRSGASPAAERSLPSQYSLLQQWLA